MESERHLKQASLLWTSLDAHWADRQDVFIASDLWLYFSAAQAKKNHFRAPDVMVVVDTERRERKAWVVWEEDGRVPDVVIEILSDSTAHVDRGEKKRVYERLGVPEYFLYDAEIGDLEAYRLSGGRYARIRPEPSGRARSRRLGLDLGVWRGIHHGIEAPWLRWFEQGGPMVPTLEERAGVAEDRAAAAEDRAADDRARAAAAEDRAAEERARAAAAEDRAADLAARLATYVKRFGGLEDKG
jgi:Uma2 family endonuclease